MKPLAGAAAPAPSTGVLDAVAVADLAEPVAPPSAGHAFARAITDGGSAWRARDEAGRIFPLALERWLGEPTPAELALLERVHGPALDVGCGPGRLVAALAERDVPALGIDLVPAAVAAARRRGARAVVADVLRRVPFEGRWATVLLLDGSIGIGGDPGALLRRLAEVLRDDGDALVELDSPQTRTERVRLRLEGSGPPSRWFSWARVSAAGIEPVANQAGLAVAEMWQAEGRWFVRLARERRGHRGDAQANGS